LRLRRDYESIYEASNKVLVKMSLTPGGINCISAFVDEDTSHSFMAIISKDKRVSNYVPCSLINSKIINAFIRRECVKRTLTTSSVRAIPVPEFSDEQITKIEKYYLSIKEAYVLRDKKRVQQIQEKIMCREYQSVKFLDAGHGDSSVIYLNNNETKDSNVVVIDIADSNKLLKELEFHKIKVIDFIIISHSDADHCRGVNDFLEKYMMVAIVKNICFNLGKSKLTKTMKLFNRKCYGDIEASVIGSSYEIKTETENLPLLDHSACSESSC